jgi:hypothetical protein
MNRPKIKHFDYLAALTCYFIIGLFVLGGILFSPGTIGLFHDWFIAPYHEMNKSWANSSLYVWDSKIGKKVYDTEWIFRLSLLPIPFLGGEVLSKGLLILIITLSGFGAFCLGRRLKLNWYVSFAAGVLYTFSPIIFTRIVAGHLYYLIAYFLTPLIIAAFLTGKEQNNKKYFIVAGLLLSFAVIQLQFLVLVLLILLIFSLVDFKQIKTSIIGLSIITTITILITFSPILLPQLIIKSTETPFNINQLLSYHELVSADDLAKSFRILGYSAQPYDYLDLGNVGIMPSWIFYLDFIIPIVGFSALLFRRDKYTVSFAVISILGLYLLKGLNPPFPGVFAFFFTHGFYIFRELWHVAFLYSFSITFLIALLLDRLWLLKFRPLVKVSICVTLISVIVVSNGYPLLLGNFAGYLQTYDFPNEYQTLYNKFSSDPHYNVLILPYVPPIRYDNLSLVGIDPFVTHTSNMIFPTHFGGRATPTQGASIWLLSSIQENKTQNLGRILTGFGIEYVILRKDSVSEYPNYTPLSSVKSFREKWFTPLEPILDSQKDMKVISDTSQYKVYENLNNATKIFAPSTYAGGLSDFDSLLSIANVTSISNVAIHDSVSDRDSLVFLDNIQEANMPLNYFVDIGGYADTFDPRNGWTDKIHAFGFDHLFTSRLMNGIISASPNRELSIELPVNYINKDVEIWMKALSWNQGGGIKIRIDGAEYPLSLLSPNRSFELVKIFEGKSDVPLQISIQNIRGKNYVEGLYVREKGLQHLSTSTNNKIILNNPLNQKAPNLIANSNFSVDNQSGLPLYWNDSLKRCDRYFNCKVNGTDSWDGKNSFQFFTKYPHNISGIWSSTYGQQIEVKPNERYELIIHMKLNKWATQSHVALEGFNETSKQWYQITKCPANLNGPIRWEQFSCVVAIPENTTKVRPVLNAGWSPELKKASKTWFDALSLTKLNDEKESPNLAQIKKLILPEIGGNNKSSSLTTTTTIKEFNKVNPTLWNVHISTSKPATTIGFAEPYDHSWEATVYKDGKKIDVVKSMPLYGAINSFQINQTGNLDIILSFAPQYWYQVGLVISGLTFVFCIFYIIYDWRKNKERKSSSSSVSNQV